MNIFIGFSMFGGIPLLRTWATVGHPAANRLVVLSLRTSWH